MLQEIWKDISGYEGYYQISNLGRVRSLDRYINRCSPKGKNYLVPISGQLISIYNSNGYLFVPLNKKGIASHKPIHKLIAQKFIFNPKNKPEINHKNGIKDDNRIENLEWSTRSENMKHAFNSGLISNSGMNNSNHKLNEFQIRVIRKAIDLNSRELSMIFRVDYHHINRIRSRKSWKHIV